MDSPHVETSPSYAHVGRLSLVDETPSILQGTMNVIHSAEERISTPRVRTNSIIRDKLEGVRSRRTDESPLVSGESYPPTASPLSVSLHRAINDSVEHHRATPVIQQSKTAVAAAAAGIPGPSAVEHRKLASWKLLDQSHLRRLLELFEPFTESHEDESEDTSQTPTRTRRRVVKKPSVNEKEFVFSLSKIVDCPVSELRTVFRRVDSNALGSIFYDDFFTFLIEELRVTPDTRKELISYHLAPTELHAPQWRTIFSMDSVAERLLVLPHQNILLTVGEDKAVRLWDCNDMKLHCVAFAESSTSQPEEGGAIPRTDLVFTDTVRQRTTDQKKGSMALPGTWAASMEDQRQSRAASYTRQFAHIMDNFSAQNLALSPGATVAAASAVRVGARVSARSAVAGGWTSCAGLHVVGLHQNYYGDDQASMSSTVKTTREAIRHSAVVTDVTYLESSKEIIVATLDCTIRIWEPRGRAVAEVGRIKTQVAPLCIYGSNELIENVTAIVCGDVDGGVTVFERPGSRRQVVFSLPSVHEAGVSVLTVIPGICIVSASLDGSVAVIEPENRPLTARRLKGHSKAVYALAYSRGLDMLATAGQDKRVLLWNPFLYKHVASLSGHRSTVISLVFSDACSQLYSMSSDGAVFVWNARTLQLVQEVVDDRGTSAIPTTRLERRLTCAALDEEHGRLLASGSTVCAWKIIKTGGDSDGYTDDTTTTSTLIRGHRQSPIILLEQSIEFGDVVSVAMNATVNVWDTKQWPWTNTASFIAAHGQKLPCPPLVSACLDARGRRLITASVTGSILMWNFSSGSPIFWFRMNKEESADDLRDDVSPTLTFSYDGTSFPREVSSMAFLPGNLIGQHPLVTVSPLTKDLAWWLDPTLPSAICEDWNSRQVDKCDLRLVHGYGGGGVNCVIRGVDDTSVITGSSTGHIAVWRADATSVYPFLRLPVIRDPDGTAISIELMAIVNMVDWPCLAVTDSLGNIHIYSLRGGGSILKEFAARVPGTDEFSGVVFTAMAVSDDGKWLVCGDARGFLHLWNLEKMLQTEREREKMIHEQVDTSANKWRRVAKGGLLLQTLQEESLRKLKMRSSASMKNLYQVPETEEDDVKPLVPSLLEPSYSAFPSRSWQAHSMGVSTLVSVSIDEVPLLASGANDGTIGLFTWIGQQINANDAEQLDQVATEFRKTAFKKKQKMLTSSKSVRFDAPSVEVSSKRDTMIEFVAALEAIQQQLHTPKKKEKEEKKEEETLTEVESSPQIDHRAERIRETLDWVTSNPSPVRTGEFSRPNVLSL